ACHPLHLLAQFGRLYGLIGPNENCRAQQEKESEMEVREVVEQVSKQHGRWPDAKYAVNKTQPTEEQERRWYIDDIHPLPALFDPGVPKWKLQTEMQKERRKEKL